MRKEKPMPFSDSSLSKKSAKKNQIYAALKRTPAEQAIFIDFLMARIVRAKQHPAL